MTGDRRDGTRLLAHLALASWLLLAITGVWLMYFYRPTAAAAYEDMETLRSAVTFGLVIQRIHSLLAILAVLLPLTVAVLHFQQPRVGPAWTAIVATCTSGFAWFTGQLLPWDQLALWAVTTGTNMMGFKPVFGDNVRFVLLGGVEISRGTLMFWLVVHTLILPLVLALLSVLYWRISARSSSPDGLSWDPSTQGYQSH